MYSPYVANIRYYEKASIKNAMLPGSILQIYGPPMAGKAVLVDQFVSDIESTRTLKRYEIVCKGASRIENVLVMLMQCIDCTFNEAPTVPTALRKLTNALADAKDDHHIFIFYKCECLRLAGSDHTFIQLLSSLANECLAVNLKINIIFTSYVTFPNLGLKIELIPVGMLNDSLDILSLLIRYATENEDLEIYVNICKQTLSFPEGVARVAEEFLTNKSDFLSPESLLEMISSDVDFLSILFEKRVNEVDVWLSKNEMKFILNSRPSIITTYTEDLWREVNQKTNPSHNYHHWQHFFKKLCDKQIVQQQLESGSLTIHPLVVYYCMNVNSTKVMTPVRSFNWNTHFLCRVLLKTEENIKILPNSRQSTSHWSEIRLLLQTAIHHPDDGSFNAFFKISIYAGRLIALNFTDDGKEFYSNLLHAADVLGSPEQKAVIEAHCGNLAASGADIDWQKAEKRLGLAMLTLKREKMFHFYRWAAVRKAIILQRQAKLQKALKYYKAAKETLSLQSRTDIDDSLKVHTFLEDDENLTAEIYETTPLIFTGKATEAIDMLMNLMQKKKTEIKSHPSYPIFLNNLGLAYERGEDDLRKTSQEENNTSNASQSDSFRSNALFWYKKSLKVRRTLGKYNPQLLVVSLNNIAALLLKQETPESLQESESYLNEALKIQHDTHWHYRDKALTLNNLAKVNMYKLNFLKALKLNSKAFSVLKTKAKNSDFRLQVLLDLVHCRIVLGLQRSQLELTEPEFDDGMLDESVEDYLEGIIDIESKSKVDSSDFHQMYLSACLHGMLFCYKHSRDKFEKYKSLFTLHVEQHELFTKYGEDYFKNQPHFFNNCRDLYRRLKITGFHSIDVQNLTEYLITFCTLCVKLAGLIEEYPWKKTVSGPRFAVLPSCSRNSRVDSMHRQPTQSDLCLDITTTVKNLSEPESYLLSTSIYPEMDTSVSDLVVNGSVSYSDGKSTCSTENSNNLPGTVTNPSLNST